MSSARTLRLGLLLVLVATGCGALLPVHVAPPPPGAEAETSEGAESATVEGPDPAPAPSQTSRESDGTPEALRLAAFALGEIEVTSEPSGAALYDPEGRLLGITPARIPRALAPLELSVRAEGHTSTRVRVTAESSAQVTLSPAPREPLPEGSVRAPPLAPLAQVVRCHGPAAPCFIGVGVVGMPAWALLEILGSPERVDGHLWEFGRPRGCVEQWGRVRVHVRDGVVQEANAELVPTGAHCVEP